jgi:hypothetical protein
MQVKIVSEYQIEKSVLKPKIKIKTEKYRKLFLIHLSFT